MAGVAIQGGLVAFDDLSGQSPIITAERESRSIRRIGRINWSQGDALIAECFPAAPALPGAYPGVAYLYCQRITIRPEHDRFATTAGNVPTYHTAVAEIEYKTLPYDASTLLTHRYSFSAEMLSIPPGDLHWNSDAEPIKQDDLAPGKLIPLIEHSITYHRVVSVPWAAIRDNIGHVNNGAFNGAADETLMFVGAEVSFEYSTDGTQVWTLDYRFQERRIKDGANIRGWNHTFRPDTGKWDKILDHDGNFLFPTSADFDDLFA